MGTDSYAVTVRGFRPLLQNRYPLSPDKKMSRRGATYDPQSEAKTALHTNDDGVICEPSSHMEGCIVDAARDFKVPGKGRRTYLSYVRAGVVIIPEMIPIRPQNYIVDLRSVVIQHARVPKARPRFNEWELDFTAQVTDPEIIEGATLKSIIESAGRFTGIGDYRPKFGLFTVTRFERTG